MNQQSCSTRLENLSSKKSLHQQWTVKNALKKAIWNKIISESQRDTTTCLALRSPLWLLAHDMAPWTLPRELGVSLEHWVWP